MATITRGYSFVDGEQVSPSKLNQLVNGAVLSGVEASELDDGLMPYFYSDSSPGLTHGRLWFDTTPGQEGMKYAFVSPSNASVAGWCYLTPRREAYFWTNSAVSAGQPLCISRTQFAVTGLHARIFDGLFFPTVWAYSAHSGGSWAYPSWVVATEAAPADSPVRCAWIGAVPVWTGSSDLTAGNPLFVNVQSNNLSWKNGAPSQRSLVLGSVLHSTSNPTAAAVAALFWGACAHQDIV
jgi:hypothetical protein